MNLEILDNFANSLDGKRIFDIGAGSGEVSDYFADLGFQVTSIDSSSEAYEKLLQLPVTALHADILSYNTPDLFDGILFLNTIHLFPERNWRDLILKIISFLNNGGKLLLSVPLKDKQIFIDLLTGMNLKLFDVYKEEMRLASGKNWYYFIVAK